MIIKWHPSGNAFSRASFVQVNENQEAIGSPVTCKDYLTDRLRGIRNNKTVTVYHVEIYNPEKMPSSNFEKARIASGSPNPDKILDFINQVEDHFGIPHSTYQEIEEYRVPGAYHSIPYYWEGDKIYMLAPPLYGLWCLLIRNGIRHVIGRDWRLTLRECESYLAYSLPAIEFAFKEGPVNVFGEDLDYNWGMPASGDYMHGVVGPYAYSVGHTKTYFPKWRAFEG